MVKEKDRGKAILEVFPVTHTWKYIYEDIHVYRADRHTLSHL